MITMYQHNQAVQAAGGDASKWIWKCSVTRVRARVRAKPPCSCWQTVPKRAPAPNVRRMKNRSANGAFHHRSGAETGQLDNTQLTLRDLSTITDAFVTILRGTHHPRITYPKEGRQLKTSPRCRAKK